MVILRKAIDVRPCRGGEDERDRWEDPERRATTSKDEMDEGSACPTVAIHERVDCLELSVSDGDLGDDLVDEI